MERDLADDKDVGNENDQLYFHSLEEKFSVFFIHENSHKQTFERDENDFVYHSQEQDDPTERMEYWESQEALLQDILERYSSVGRKLRQDIVKIIVTAKETNNFCNCTKPRSDGCAYCLRRRVVQMLAESGFNASLCTSKWKHTSKLPGGMHEYIELIVSTPGKKKQIPFLIEIQFREEFEMAKACHEYHELVKLLPEIYIGKSDNLNAMIRVVCDAAKRSAKERRIHIGLWRRRSFMQMKWLGKPTEKGSSVEQKTACNDNFSNLLSSKPDLLSIVPGIRSSPSTVVEVS